MSQNLTKKFPLAFVTDISVSSLHMTQTWEPPLTEEGKKKHITKQKEKKPLTNALDFIGNPDSLQKRRAVINHSLCDCDYRLNMISRWEGRLSSIYCQTRLKLCVSKVRSTPFSSVLWEGLSHHIRNLKSPLV